MTIWNLGSINVDHVYQVPEFVAPGETLTAKAYAWGLGGKGLNQTVAALRSDGKVHHMGAIGRGDTVTRQALVEMGIKGAWEADAATGHAMIQVNAAGENCIVLAPGANRALLEAEIERALEGAQAGDWLLLQNETSSGAFTVRLAKEKGLKVCYAAAPFEASSVAELMGQIDLLSVNEVELAQLEAAMSISGVARLVTLGSRGAYYEDAQGARTEVEAFSVTPVDTTGAGDTFLGAFLAKLDAGQSIEKCLTWASAAGAMQVTRPGAATVIPTASEIEDFLKEQAT